MDASILISHSDKELAAGTFKHTYGHRPDPIIPEGTHRSVEPAPIRRDSRATSVRPTPNQDQKQRPRLPESISEQNLPPLLMIKANDIVLEALCSLGISKMTRPEDVEFLCGVKPACSGYNIDKL